MSRRFVLAAIAVLAATGCNPASQQAAIRPATSILSPEAQSAAATTLAVRGPFAPTRTEPSDLDSALEGAHTLARRIAEESEKGAVALEETAQLANEADVLRSAELALPVDASAKDASATGSRIPARSDEIQLAIAAVAAAPDPKARAARAQELVDRLEQRRKAVPNWSTATIGGASMSSTSRLSAWILPVVDSE